MNARSASGKEWGSRALTDMLQRSWTLTDAGTMRESSVSSSEEEELEPEERPVSALAPQADTGAETPAFSGANSAFQCLDELFSAGKLSETRAAGLKVSLKLLQDTLQSSQESEVRLLQEARRRASEVQRLRQQLEEAEHVDEAPGTEGGSMRRRLLRLDNDLQLSEEQESQLQFQLESLEDTKHILQARRKSQLNAAERERRLEAVKQSCEDLKMEIAQKRVEIGSLQEKMEAKQKQLQADKQEMEDKKETIELLEAQLVQLLPKPLQLRKEIERITSKKEATMKRKAGLDEELSEMGHLLKKVEDRLRALEEELQTEVQELKKRREQLEEGEHRQGLLQQELSVTREKLAALGSWRCSLEINISHAASEKKSVREALGRRTREKDRLLRSLKKLELQLKLANETLEYTESQCSRAKAQRDAVPRGDEMLQQRRELEKEVENLKHAIMHQQSKMEVEAQVAEELMEKEQALIREAHRCRQNLQHLTCLTQIKADERQQKSWEIIRAQQRFRHVKQELRSKSLVIWEHRRQKQDVQARLAAFAKLYDVVKKERNRCVDLIQTASGNLERMQECFIHLENQMKIMQTAAINNEKLLQKARLKHLHSCTIRDSLRKDISQAACVLNAMRDQREEQRLGIGELTHSIELHEQDLLSMQRSCNRAKQDRRERGIQLLEREQEIHNLQKKLSVQDSLIQDGNMEMQNTEEEMHFLSLHISEEKRQIKILRKELLDRRALEEEIAKLQEQLLECRNQVRELEEAMADPGRENRTRYLDGQDPSPAELHKKVEQLEARLADQEKQLLEKELLYEQVTRLAGRTQAKAQNGTQDTLLLAKKVNKVQGHIKDATRKMMATLSELSMQQASAVALQQQVKTGEHHLDSCCRRLEQGLPPSPDMELEWQRGQRDRQQHRAALQERTRLREEEQRIQPLNSTAKTRPDSYLPQGDELPLPRPYGALAPFMPTEPGSNMRHIRKPEPKPIEI